MRAANAESWVVYQMPVKGVPAGVRGICDQAEWDAMELARPGVNTLIQGGFTSEGEAERLARGASGAARPRSSKGRLTSWPGEVATALSGATGPMAG
jgi:hypothetical protein